MKLSDLQPCIACNGALVGPAAGGPIFYVVDVTQAMLDERATRQVLGLDQILGTGHAGAALGLAEVMAPNAEGAVKLFSEMDPQLKSRLFFCQNCYVGMQKGTPGDGQFMKAESLAIYAERAEHRRARKEKAVDPA